MGMLKSLLHRGEATPPKSLEWPPAPQGVCDICNAEVPDAGSARVPGAQFRALVQRGYNPVGSGRMELARQLFGGTDAEVYENWKGMILEDTTDWALCGECAADLRGFAGEAGAPPVDKRTALLQETFGDDAPKLVAHLGRHGAEAFAQATVAEVRARWARFADKETLSDAEEAEKSQRIRESGQMTIAGAAVVIQEFMAERALSEEAFGELRATTDESHDPEERIKSIAGFVAEKIAGDVASEEMAKANLPEEMHLDIGARLYLVIVPMRVGFG